MAVDSQATVKYPKFLTFASLPTRKQIVLLEIDFNLSLAMGIYFSVNKKNDLNSCNATVIDKK